MWNKAWENRPLIQQHCFWEIGNGQHALFWDDAWEKSPRLDTETYRPLKEYLEEQNKIKVRDCWKNDNNTDWREWKNINDLLPVHIHHSIHTLMQELSKRQIQKEEGPDILRWGAKTTGTFSIKEAYNHLQHPTYMQEDNKWKRLWNRKHWPNISLFIWLLTHTKNLT